MIEILLQIDPNQFKEATPYSWGVYGILVLGLVAALIFVTKYFVIELREKTKEHALREAEYKAKLEIKEKEYKEVAEKSIIVLTEIKEKVLDIKDYRITVLGEFAEIRRHIKELEDLIRLNKTL